MFVDIIIVVFHLVCYQSNFLVYDKIYLILCNIAFVHITLLLLCYISHKCNCWGYAYGAILSSLFLYNKETNESSKSKNYITFQFSVILSLSKTHSSTTYWVSCLLLRASVEEVRSDCNWKYLFWKVLVLRKEEFPALSQWEWTATIGK